jgi:hypothetical protein
MKLLSPLLAFWRYLSQPTFKRSTSRGYRRPSNVRILTRVPLHH